MKIRLGFVSNSSSSNFVVAFSRKPRCVEEVQREMFGENKTHPYDLFDGVNNYSTLEIANRVYMSMQKPASKTKVIKAISNGFYDGHPDWPSYDLKLGSSEWKAAWKKYQEDNEAGAKKMAEDFLARNKGKKIYTFSYGDEDGPFDGMMEHSEIFRNLPYIQISCH